MTLSQLPRIKKPKLLRSNPLRYTLIHNLGYNPADIHFDDENIIADARRKTWKPSTGIDLPDGVKLRLLEARKRALEAWIKKWG